MARRLATAWLCTAIWRSAGSVVSPANPHRVPSTCAFDNRSPDRRRDADRQPCAASECEPRTEDLHPHAQQVRSRQQARTPSSAPATRHRVGDRAAATVNPSRCFRRPGGELSRRWKATTALRRGGPRSDEMASDPCRSRPVVRKASPDDTDAVRVGARSWSFVLCTMVACGDDDERMALDPLGEAQARWEADGVDSYDFTIRYTAEFLHGTYRISVRDGVAVHAERVPAIEGVDFLNDSELPTTIDEVFDHVEREVAAPVFDVGFDDELGYPTHLFADRIEEAVDDEQEFFIEDVADRTAAN